MGGQKDVCVFLQERVQNLFPITLQIDGGEHWRKATERTSKTEGVEKR